jgi:lipoprotein-anchoring transpeptidase ErfK/SrfK
MSKKPLLAGITLGAATIAVAASAFITPQSTTAHAQNLAKQSAKAVAKLSPTEKQQLSQKGAYNPEGNLQEAQSAKDLQTLTYDQIKNQLPPSHPQQTSGHSSGNGADLSTLKYLKYTNSQGITVILGINKDNLPVFGAQRQ